MRLRRPDVRKAFGFPVRAARPCPEEVVHEVRPSERQSLSASQAAEPQATASPNLCMPLRIQHRV